VAVERKCYVPLLCRFCVMSSPCSITLLLCFFLQAAVIRARWAVPGGSVVSNDGERERPEREVTVLLFQKNVPPFLSLFVACWRSVSIYRGQRERSLIMAAWGAGQRRSVDQWVRLARRDSLDLSS